MGASAARHVRAERARRRLPPRMRHVRWGRRVAGVLGTAVLLGIGVAMGLMVMPHKSRTSGAVVGATPAATPVPTRANHHTATKPAHKPGGPTKAQRRQLRAALAEVQRQGYQAVRRSDYDVTATLRVLIAHPLADDGGPRRAFFFVGGRYIGHDAAEGSAKLSVAAHGKRFVTLAYGVCCPAARRTVRFQWDHGELTPLDVIPPAVARAARPA